MLERNGGQNKMNKAPNNQGISLAADADDTKTLAEYLSELRRQTDWLMGVYGIPLDDLNEQQSRCRKDSQIAALCEFVGLSQ